MAGAPLFCDAPLSTLRDEAVAAIGAAVDRLNPAQALTIDSRIDDLVQAALPAPARLDRAGLVFKVVEHAVPSTDLTARSASHRALAVTLRIPFSGDARFFRLTAASGLGETPEGEIDDDGLRLTLVTHAMDETAVVEAVIEALARIEALLERQRQTVERWRRGLRRIAADAAASRRDRLAMLDRTTMALEAAGFRQAEDVRLTSAGRGRVRPEREAARRRTDIRAPAG